MEQLIDDIEGNGYLVKQLFGVNCQKFYDLCIK